MKRRWKLLLGALGLTLAAAAAPILYIETQCSDPLPGLTAHAPYRSLLPGTAGRRPEPNTWLTYPEWSIVYSADTNARFLATGRPSRFPYLRQVAGFWRGHCAVNRAAAASGGSAHYSVMLYTIGLSFSAEMLLKGLYENTLGAATEWVSGGANSGSDHYAAEVQRRYGAFMHETPWYRFPFGDALAGLWVTPLSGNPIRHYERRIALTFEYGFKALYAGAIGWASGATLGRDELTLRFVARAAPERLTAIDRRLRPVGTLPGGLTIVEAPRYAQFTDLLLRLSATEVEIPEIAGNDDIQLTILAPTSQPAPAGTYQLFAIPLDDRPGWRRLGLGVKVDRLLPLLRAVRASGGEVEHVYDY